MVSSEHPVVPAFRAWTAQVLPKDAHPTSTDTALFFALMKRTDDPCVAGLEWPAGIALLEAACHPIGLSRSMTARPGALNR